MTENLIGFIDQKVKEEYDKAKIDNPKLYKFLERATNDLKEDPFCGIKIPKNFWPKNMSKNTLLAISGSMICPTPGG